MIFCRKVSLSTGPRCRGLGPGIEADLAVSVASFISSSMT